MILFALLALLAGGPIGDGTVERACAPTGRAAYGVFEYLGDRRCLAFEPARTMTGVWVNDFEGSAFYEGARSWAELEAGVRQRPPWFEIDDATVLPSTFRRRYYHAYRITFVGRQAKPRPRDARGSPPGMPEPPGGFGHLGMSTSMVLADRVIRSEDLGPRFVRGRNAPPRRDVQPRS